MSDSEENRSGASSALLNIASAYSDSDSSQDNCEDFKPQKSLGSLVENLRAEAKKSECEVIKLSEGQNRINAAPVAAHPGELDKTLSVTKIVRLDSGKVVKISTSSASKVTEFRHEDSNTRTGGNTSETVVGNNNRTADSVVADRHILRESFSNSASSNTVGATVNSVFKTGAELVDAVEPTPAEELGDSVLDQLNEDISIVNANCNLDTQIYNVKSEIECFDLNSDVSATSDSTHLPVEVSVESTKADNQENMGIGGSKEEVKLSDEKTAEGNVGSDSTAAEALSRESLETRQSSVDIVTDAEWQVQHGDVSAKHSKTWSRGTDSVGSSECNDNVRSLTDSLLGIEETISSQGFNVTKNEESSNAEVKTESNILNAHPNSNQEKRLVGEVEKSEDDLNRKAAAEVKVNERSGSNENISQTNENVQDSVEKVATAGSVAVSDSSAGIDKGTNDVAHVKSSENCYNRNVEDSISSKGEESEVKTRAEVKPLPRLERIKLKSPVAASENLAKKTETNLQSSPAALYKMLESCEAHQPTSAPEVKRTTGPGPIKLKRNFGCISLASSDQPEKKFRPEPSEAARSVPSGAEGPPPPQYSDAEAIIPPTKSEVCAQPPSTPRPLQQEPVQSPPGMQIPSPSRSPLSPTFSPASPQQQSYQPSFTNIINTPQTQVPAFQPLKKSPQPVVQQSQRVTRREEQKRTLPLILRKAEVSSAKTREHVRVEDGPTRCSPRKEEVSAHTPSKVTSEVEISIETTSSESQEQSVSAPFSNSSSNQESSNIGASADYDNMMGPSVVCKEANVPSLPVDSGLMSDNAQPPPTEDEEPKAPTSFLSQSVPPLEMPTIIIPKKRGRPRKFPLPETAPLVGTWPMMGSTNKSTPKSGKRKKPVKKFKGDGDGTDDEDTPKKRFISRFKKKKKPGEEPEVPRCFNKKGRMEVMTEGCKPVTVHQITEYFWPPVSSLSPGEKPEGLMIQEQISEYLGVKSFKRKYPSIKRRPVDMEERNYLQENGYVSENMCDLGLTAVYSADIIEIMYNDFPHKFEEYRRYSREKKMKEQKALREKQAAENMDPRKEAVDSAVSWNTEFNKTRKFRVWHLDPHLRDETKGMAVAPFEKVLVVHAPVDVPLCVESSFWENSLFSPECEVSVHAQMTLKKEYDIFNQWIFVVGTLK